MRGTTTALGSKSSSRRQTGWPRKPAPPVTTTRRPRRKLIREPPWFCSRTPGAAGTVPRHRVSIMALQDEPRERPQLDLGVRIREEGVQRLPGRLDQLARLPLAGVEGAAGFESLDHTGDDRRVAWPRRQRRPQGPPPLGRQ